MPLLWKDDDGAQWETHAGLVISGPHTRCVRVMDVYSDECFAVVWDANRGTYDEVHIGGAFELNTKWATVVVDAPESILALVAQKRAAQAAARADRKREEARKAEEAHAKREVLAPRRGRTVQVVGGRKVPKGTKGTVFWTDTPTNFTRVGIKDANDATHWVDARWCEATYADFPVGSPPACGWVAYRDALRAQEEAHMATLPKVKKGDTVTLSTTGLTGTVYWVGGTRIGVGFGTERDGVGNYLNKAWADLSEVAAVNAAPVVEWSRTNPCGEIPCGGEQAAVVLHNEASAPLPWPYSAIDKLDLEGGLYAAYDAKGGFLLHLDYEGAREVLLLMPQVTVVPAAPAL